jgi:hypothetical protein
VSSNRAPLVRLTSEHRQGRTRIRVEGWLGQRDLGLLEAECQAAWRKARSITLDLSGLRSLDREGALGIERLRRGGLRVRGASGFVRSLLDAVRG